MTTRYAKVNFPLQLSSTSSYSDQLLPGDFEAQEFTTTQSVIDTGGSIGPGTANPYHADFDLSSWTTVDLIYVRCLDTSTATGFWVEWCDVGDPTTGLYKWLSLGEEILLPSIDPAGDSGYGAALSLEIAHTPDLVAYFDVIILGT